MLTAQQVRDQVEKIRGRTQKPVNVNFFCHKPPRKDNAREAARRDRLAPYYRELGLDPNMAVNAPNRAPFDAEMCELMEELKPAVASFHFGLPEAPLVARVKAAGARIVASATSVEEARWLVDRGADAIIAQGYEAGGHRGMFLTEDLSAQIGTFALVPQVADAVDVPVIAAGGVTDARGIAAALALGAAGVQMGTAFLFCAEAKISAPHRAAFRTARERATAVTNLMTGRPARGFYNRVMREIGPVSALAPEFPLAAAALAPLRAKAEAQGSGDFSPLWSGQAAPLGREMPARELIASLVAEARQHLSRLGAGAAG